MTIKRLESTERSEKPEHQELGYNSWFLQRQDSGEKRYERWPQTLYLSPALIMAPLFCRAFSSNISPILITVKGIRQGRDSQLHLTNKNENNRVAAICPRYELVAEESQVSWLLLFLLTYSDSDQEHPKHGTEEEFKTLDFSEHSLFILPSLLPLHSLHPSLYVHIEFLNSPYIYPRSLPWCLKVSDSISELFNHKALTAIRHHVLRETVSSISSSSECRCLMAIKEKREMLKKERPGRNTLLGENISNDS